MNGQPPMGRRRTHSDPAGAPQPLNRHARRAERQSYSGLGRICLLEHDQLEALIVADLDIMRAMFEWSAGKERPLCATCDHVFTPHGANPPTLWVLLLTPNRTHDCLSALCQRCRERLSDDRAIYREIVASLCQAGWRDTHIVDPANLSARAGHA